MYAQRSGDGQMGITSSWSSWEGELTINDRFAVELWRIEVDRAKESTQRKTHTTTKTDSCQTDEYLDK
jgi:hypothetical protein